MWEAVQKINQAASLRSVGRQEPTKKLFSGKLICVDCKAPLNANTETQRRKNGTSKRYVSYFCGTYGRSGRSVCSWHRIYEKTLAQLVTAEIKAQAQAITLDEAAVVNKLKCRIADYDGQRLTATKQEIPAFPASPYRPRYRHSGKTLSHHRHESSQSVSSLQLQSDPPEQTELLRPAP